MRHKSIPYVELKQKIQSAEPNRVRPFAAFMYGSACRIGELLPYNHIYKVMKGNGNRKKWMGDVRREETGGLTKEGVIVEKDGITIFLKNFKNKKREEKEIFISEQAEPWLTEIIREYVSRRGYGVLFPFRRHTAMNAMKELGIRSHDLRHSRLTHLARFYGFSNYEIKETAGHASLETSAIYVHLKKGDIKHKLDNPVLKRGLE